MEEKTLPYSPRFVKYYDLFLKYKEERDQEVRFLSKNSYKRNIIDYVKDSVDRMNEYVTRPSWKEDWQSSVFDPKTRDKVITLLSILAANRMKPELLVKPGSIFYTENLEARKQIYTDLLEAANYKNFDERQLIWEMYTGLSEGTVIGFEGWKKDTRDIEWVKDYDPDTGAKKTEKIKYDAWDDVYGEIVPLDEWYPETIWTNDIDNIHRCFWAKEMSFQAFKDVYGKFPGSDKVMPKEYFQDGNNLPWGISSNIGSENVQVIHYYDEVDDKMGIWANTQELYFGALPWNHKRIPFWLATGEPIHNKFIFGKSMPDKLMGMQDIDNAILNSMLDQLLLAVNSPVFVSGMVGLEDGYLEPGRIYEVEPGTQAQKISLGQVDQVSFQMLDLIRRSMEESSVSPQSQGVPTGGRKTKYEVQQLQQGALNLSSLFLTLMENAMRRKYWLRMHNIIQYYSMPSRDKKGKSKFKLIILDDVKLGNQKNGKKMIQIVNSNNELPSKLDMAKMAENMTGKKFDVLNSRFEPIAMTRDYLLGGDFDLEIRIVPNSSVKDSQVDKDNKFITWFNATAQDPMVDHGQNLKQFAKVMGQDEGLVKEQESPIPGGGNELESLMGNVQKPNLQLI